MELFANIWNGVVWFFMLPVTAFSGDLMAGPDGAIDIFIGVVLVLFVWGGTIAVLIGAYALLHWRATTEPCQHCRKRTKLVSEGSCPSCLAAQPCCQTCVDNHAAERTVATEKRVLCPNDDATMEKAIWENDVVVDVCPVCDAVFLSQEELDRLREISYGQGYSRGRSSGSTTGLATGIAIGSIG